MAGRKFAMNMKEKRTGTTNKEVTTNEKKIPVVEENISIGKKKLETGKVRITKKVMEEEVPLNFTGIEEEIEIDVKKIGKVVDKPGKAVRTEGDTTIYSVYREVFVKQTILEEEVWVTKKRNEKTFKGPEKLKREVIDIEREPKKLKKDQ